MNIGKRFQQDFSLSRLASRVSLVIGALLLAACGDGYFAVGSDGFYYEGSIDYRSEHRHNNCRSVVYPAVVVQFFAVEDGRRLAVAANGELEGRDGISVLRTDRSAGSGLVYSLAGGFDRAGTFDVFVSARRVGDGVSQSFVYNNVRVDSDDCGPIPVFLDATLN